MRALKGNPVTVSHGLAESLAQIEALPESEREPFKSGYIAFADSLVSHLWLDGGKLCMAHAGMKEPYIGRASGRVRDFALYGETTGETDEFGLPVRLSWAQDYRGATTVVYGHTPVPRAEWLNNTLNVDTGCVFGGSLTALRWPEREIVQVPARQIYAVPARLLFPNGGAEEKGKQNRRAALGTQEEGSQCDVQNPNAEIASLQPCLQWQHDELLRAEDVLGKRIVTTRLLNNITVPAENAAAALEVMSRFAVDPRWLIYLPPTMSPCETAPEGDFLERPQEAFAYYRRRVWRKWSASASTWAAAPLSSSAEMEAAQTAVRRDDGETGVCYTRTGRQFFDDPECKRALLDDIGDALTARGFLGGVCDRLGLPGL